MRSVEEIYQEMKAAFTQRAGFDPGEGCDLAVRLRAAAAQIQALEIQGAWVLDQSFPQTASGVYLDRHADMRGLSRLPAAAAVGTLRFYLNAAAAAEVTVPAGTVCMTAAGRRFETTEAAVISAGGLSGDAPARALEGGADGNAAAGTVCILTACPMAVTGCSNPAAFTGGSGEEDDEALRARILESYRRLPNGANAAWYETTALSHAAVAAARAVGRARGTGTVDVYIAAESGVPDAALLEEVQADLADKREIAVDVLVKAPAPVTVNVAAEIAVASGADFAAVKTAAEQAVAALFTGRLLGLPVRLAELTSRLYALEGVENCRVTSPAADVAGDVSKLPVLGTLTVTEMEA